MQRKFAYMYSIFTCIIVIGVFIIVNMNYDRLEVYNGIDANNYYENIRYNIDSVEEKDGTMFINGWIVEAAMDNVYFNRNYLLKDSTGKMYKLKSAMVKRPDVTVHFNHGFNYDNTGIMGKVETGKLKKGEKYTIGFLLTGQDKYEKVLFTEVSFTPGQ